MTEEGRYYPVGIYALCFLYKGQKIGTRRVDFVIESCMLEIKAKSIFDPQDYVQAESYVKAAGYPLGLLVNFGGLKIEIKRIANNVGVRQNSAP